MFRTLNFMVNLEIETCDDTLETLKTTLQRYAYINLIIYYIWDNHCLVSCIIMPFRLDVPGLCIIQ